MPAAIDLTGKKFDYLTVVRKTSKRDSTGCIQWKCKCICGNFKCIPSRNLRCKGVKSCGCKTKEMISITAKGRNKTHGAAYDKSKGGVQLDYSIWHGIKDRCYNKNNKHYRNYGARGIAVCNEWKDNFEKFAAYIRKLSDCPSDEMLKSRGLGKRLMVSLDRIDNKKGYQPKNLKWSSKKEQNNNRRSNTIIKVFGQNMTLAQACDKYSNISYRTVHNRIFKLGWLPEIALTRKSRQHHNNAIEDDD